ncbi:hypothetical protein Maes01_01018 [Microbulbifer aestuariivivens]|uniref:Uncharacterized protein n=1 Tax=Microbulbifer aestuariivivens TaxID=1908308 RepID=A0ABP9WMM2_9GAMM
MKSNETGSFNKVQFCAALALLVAALQVAATELSIPMDKVERELAEKTEEIFSRKHNACRRAPRDEGVSKPRFPVRIASSMEVSGGGLGYPLGLPLVAR